MKRAPLSTTEILSALRGQSYRVPPLTSLFRAWPSSSRPNRHHADMAALAEASIDRIAAAQPKIAKRKDDDLELLTALWYPHATSARLEVLVRYTVWLVCWDDCVDAGEGGLAGDWESAEQWRVRTLNVIARSLKLRESESCGNGDVDAVNAVFQDFAVGFVGAPLAQRQRLFEELKFFVQSCAVEQKLRLEGTVPDYDSYMSFRLGTAAGRTLCALVEFAMELELPDPAADSPHRQRLWDQACVLVALINDVLSLKKEIKSGCVINAVATLLQPGKSLDDVVEEVMVKMRRAVDEFDTAAQELLRRVDDEDLKEVVVKYVDGCRTVVVGTLQFTLKSRRYQLSKILGEDGSLQLVL